MLVINQAWGEGSETYVGFGGILPADGPEAAIAATGWCMIAIELVRLIDAKVIDIRCNLKYLAAKSTGN